VASVPLCEALEDRRLFSAGKSPQIDAVLEWNEVTIETLRQDRSRLGPTQAARSLAVVQIAVFDAVEAVKRHFEPILVAARGRGANASAAAAAAAHRALLTLYPQQKVRLDAALKVTLRRIANGDGERRGVSLGRKVANKVLELRHDDGGDVIDNDTYVFIDPATGIAPVLDKRPIPVEITPGAWRPDPLNPTQRALGINVPNCRPFVMTSADELRPDPPPALDSAEYAAAYNELVLLGSKESTARTADQTEIGVFWAYDRVFRGTPVVIYNQAAKVVANNNQNTMEQNARLFAQLNVAMADAGVCSWDCKYEYNFWRPITAIRYGDLDNNPATVADPAWKPLGAPGNGVVFDFTPPFPAYVSGHSTFGAAAFTVLERFYGTDQMNFTLTSDELPGVTRSYTSFSQASAENGISRIYLGIHWAFDNTEGQKLGNAVAEEVVAKVAQPR
jgi:molybdenum-dependent DNA-binding transcriptional regulator ModE